MKHKTFIRKLATARARGNSDAVRDAINAHVGALEEQVKTDPRVADLLSAASAMQCAEYAYDYADRALVQAVLTLRSATEAKARGIALLEALMESNAASVALVDAAAEAIHIATHGKTSCRWVVERARERHALALAAAD